MKTVIYILIVLISFLNPKDNDSVLKENNDIKAIIEQLGSDDFEIREEASKKLTSKSERSIPIIINGFFEYPTETRQRLKEVLEKLLASNKTKNSVKIALKEFEKSKSDKTVTLVQDLLYNPAEAVEWLKGLKRPVGYIASGPIGLDRTVESRYFHRRNLKTDHYIKSLTLSSIKDVVELDLYDYELEDYTLLYLKGFENLERLHLNGNVSDVSLKYLRSLNLTQLTLRNIDISNNCISHLIELKKLELLDLRGTKVDGVGIREIQKKLPKCKVIDSKNDSFNSYEYNLDGLEVRIDNIFRPLREAKKKIDEISRNIDDLKRKGKDSEVKLLEKKKEKLQKKIKLLGNNYDKEKIKKLSKELEKEMKLG